MMIDAAALAVIASTPAALRSLLAKLPIDVLEQPNDEGWSLKDIVAHLVDVEDAALAGRIGRMLDEERPFIQSIDPPARLIAGGYAARGLTDLLAELQERRVANVAWLEGLTEKQLQRVGEHDEVGEIRVIDIAHQWAAHDMSHLRQIAHMIQAHMAPRMGATRGFYDV
jgi:DinB superfamily